ncbi:hypothetical protein J6590_009394 [Homalodisca vitripennis]|nr:hypothetical protein J6590_009394 [Homalodisca vitripennis]
MQQEHFPRMVGHHNVTNNITVTIADTAVTRTSCRLLNADAAVADGIVRSAGRGATNLSREIPYSQRSVQYVVQPCCVQHVQHCQCHGEKYQNTVSGFTRSGCYKRLLHICVVQDNHSAEELTRELSTLVFRPNVHDDEGFSIDSMIWISPCGGSSDIESCRAHLYATCILDPVKAQAKYINTTCKWNVFVVFQFLRTLQDLTCVIVDYGVLVSIGLYAASVAKQALMYNVKRPVLDKMNSRDVRESRVGDGSIVWVTAP